MLGWRPSSFDIRGEEFRDLVRRSREVVLLAAITGSHHRSRRSILRVRGRRGHVRTHRPKARSGWAPSRPASASRCLRSSCARWATGASSATSDEYLRAFHDPEYPLRPRAFMGRMAAAVTTLGLGRPDGPRGSVDVRGVRSRRHDPAPLAGGISRRRPPDVAGRRSGRGCRRDLQGAGNRGDLRARGAVPRSDGAPHAAAGTRGERIGIPRVRRAQQRAPDLHLRERRRRGFEYKDLAGAILIGICCAVGARAFSS